MIYSYSMTYTVMYICLYESSISGQFVIPHGHIYNLSLELDLSQNVANIFPILYVYINIYIYIYKCKYTEYIFVERDSYVYVFRCYVVRIYIYIYIYIYVISIQIQLFSYIYASIGCNPETNNTI